MTKYILALDQGTSSSRALVFDHDGNVCSVAQMEFTQHFPQPGWVEHDPMEIWASEAAVIAEAISKIGINGKNIAAIGITNQRETTIVWDAETGKPVCNAIVWQDRRTSAFCDELKARGLTDIIREKTGLIIDAYFSGTKIKWILDNVPGARERAEAGKLRFGTVDSWLVWQLTKGEVHITDVTNASRTMLFNIHTLTWDEELCRLLDIPMCMLPKPVSNSELYGVVSSFMPGVEELSGIPICGAAGDQQAALLGQGCIHPGEAKNTYGTGCFTMMNTGETVPHSNSGLLSCVAWSIGGKTNYCLEGSVFNAGSTVQWMRDELQLIHTADETQALAESVKDNGGVYLVSAFTGLGAPHWDMYARGVIVGLTRGASKAHIVRAGLEGIAYQVKDMIDAMEQDAHAPMQILKVDGGACVNRFLMQFKADILRCPIDRPAMVETTALGAAFLAGLCAGVWNDIGDITGIRQSDHIFRPKMDVALAKAYCERWRKAVERAKAWE